MAVKYRAKAGARFSNKKAQKYGTRIAELERENNGVTAEIVLQDARSPRSPLHDGFQWDNNKAAHQYRLKQARDMMQHIEVVIENPRTGKAKAQKVFIHLDDTTGRTSGKYHSLPKILSSEDLRNQMIAEALQELDFFRRKYRNLNELGAVWDAIDATRRQVGKHIEQLVG